LLLPVEYKPQTTCLHPALLVWLLISLSPELTNYCPSVLDTVGWVIWPIKNHPDITYNVFGGTLNPTLPTTRAVYLLGHLSATTKYLKVDVENGR